MRKVILSLIIPILGFLNLTPAFAQVMEGELRITVHDPDGRPVAARVELAGRNPDFRTTADTDASGEARLQRLSPGVYALVVERAGFARFEDTIEIRSAVPQQRTVTLRLGTISSEVTIRESAPLLDSTQPSLVLRVGREQLDETLGTTPGRSTVDVITTMPGWLLEANAVLHPRGSEYDTQYVIDGVPLYDNRSIAFAPAFENDEFEAINIFTAGLPAEYGRRLGGVIALDTRRASGPRSSGVVRYQAGSFGTQAGSWSHQLRSGRATMSIGAHGGTTDRYLDPPSLENYTNSGTATGVNGRLDWDGTEHERLTLYVRSNRTDFLVPNDLTQQAGGQRQDRRNSETAAQAHYQRIFSPQAIMAVRGMFRDVASALWSNPESTPVYVDQNRGFSEGAISGAVTMENDRHTLKFGGDVRLNHLRERFMLAEPDELPEFDLEFDNEQDGTETSLFVQDHFRIGNFAAHAGIRFDSYRLLIDDDAFSPRVAVSYYIPSVDLQLRASYDRIFQPPPTENLLLSSAAATLGIDEVEEVLPVPASRAHFYEVGFRKPILDIFRLDVSHYWRKFRNFQDDDVFLNTGISFPITFDTARIEGTEVRFELPRWRWLSSWVSYSNMAGHASSPVTGGLFIEGGEADELRDVAVEFPISQDQRNTVAAQARVQPHSRVWFSGGIRYGSGLPVELEDEEDEEDEQPIPPEILEQVDFERGRVKPNFSLDLSAGFRIWEREVRSLVVQFDVRNVTDRLNVINFSGLFSGTALAPGRQFTFQTRLSY
ncbi:MAG TPA: TonB-dependent receptor [Terriglobia bacterium]|nr:TonB-dependent receptor [Terriglobia bacterium]